MNNLNNEEQGILKTLIFRSCANRIKDDEYLLKLSLIYSKIFNSSLKDDYMKWKNFNKDMLKNV